MLQIQIKYAYLEAATLTLTKKLNAYLLKENITIIIFINKTKFQDSF